MRTISGAKALDILAARAAGRVLGLPDSAIWASPEAEQFLYFDPADANDLAELTRRGAKISGTAGPGNAIISIDMPSMERFRLSFNGSTGNLLLSANAHFNADVRFHSDANILCASQSFGPCNMAVNFEGGRGGFYYGYKATSNAFRARFGQPEQRVTIGDYAMWSWGITVGDGIETTVPTAGKSVETGRRVWIGQDAHLQFCCSVGNGSIIAARAIVEGAIPAMSLAAGRPARVTKQGIAWSRIADPTRAQIDAAVDDARAGAFAIS
jgi:acetyltransferase-like isoleucine patch superfamily enzyme